MYDPQQKTLLADKGEIRVGNKFQADITDLLKEGMLFNVMTDHVYFYEVALRFPLFWLAVYVHSNSQRDSFQTFVAVFPDNCFYMWLLLLPESESATVLCLSGENEYEIGVRVSWDMELFNSRWDNEILLRASEALVDRLAFFVRAFLQTSPVPAATVY